MRVSNKLSLKRMPKFVSLNKPKGLASKHILILLIVILCAFTVFYAVKMFGVGDLLKSPTERFTENLQQFYIKLVYSDHCGHCREFKPKFEKVAQKLQATHPQVKFIKTPAEEVGDFAKYASEGIPVVLFIKGELKPENVDPSLTVVGNMDEADFESKVTSFIAK